ncbi:MAG: RNA polymerase sigma factor [Gemmatimonadales bacterium]
MPWPCDPPPSPVPDATLVRRIAERDATALIEIQRRHHGSLYAQVYGIVMDPAQAERVVTRAFEQLWHSALALRSGRSTTFAWLQQTAASLARAERMAVQSH